MKRTAIEFWWDPQTTFDRIFYNDIMVMEFLLASEIISVSSLPCVVGLAGVNDNSDALRALFPPAHHTWYV